MRSHEAEAYIELKNVSFRHKLSDTDSLSNVNLAIGKGECVLLCGESGSGKTTLTRLINGLIPHFYEGELEGEAFVSGRNVTTSQMYETAGLVGSVFQNPRSQFFCVDTTSELAFGCENLGLPETEILDRVERTTKSLHAEHLMNRSIFNLSGGEKQKIACGSVSAMMPEVFVLDEPTSNLDADAIEELKQTLLMWKRQGKTILVAEHRLFWLKDVCDRVICMKDGRVDLDLPMEAFCDFSEEDFVRHGLRSIHENTAFPAVTDDTVAEDGFCLNGFRYAYGDLDALHVGSLNLPSGAIIAVTGANGAGKSTFARCLCGLQKRFRGSVTIGLKKRSGKQLLEMSYMVMQDVNHQLFCETVEDEVRLGMKSENEPRVDEVMEQLDLTGLYGRHPMAVSGGQKQRIAIASAILSDKEVLVFDEPTSGLDYRQMMKTANLIASLKGSHTVFVISHDPALIRRCCTHVLKMDKGRVQICGPIA